MKHVVDFLKLEEVLTSRWTEYLDRSKVMTFALECVRDNRDRLQKKGEFKGNRTGMRISLSRVEIVEEGLLIWIEFQVPSEARIAVGTIEAMAYRDGRLEKWDVEGTLFR